VRVPVERDEYPRNTPNRKTKGESLPGNSRRAKAPNAQGHRENADQHGHSDQLDPEEGRVECRIAKAVNVPHPARLRSEGPPSADDERRNPRWQRPISPTRAGPADM
jgi:hypothetical protein